MGTLVAKARVEADAANPEPEVAEALPVLLDRVARRVVLVKGPGVGLVLLAQKLGSRAVWVARAKRGGLTQGRPEVQQPVRHLTRTGKPVHGQKAVRVVRARLAVRAVVRAHPGGVPVVRRAVAALVSQVVGVLRAVMAIQAPQANHAQRLGVMTGSPKVLQRTSHDWASQSLREATASSLFGSC